MADNTLSGGLSRLKELWTNDHQMNKTGGEAYPNGELGMAADAAITAGQMALPWWTWLAEAQNAEAAKIPKKAAIGALDMIKNYLSPIRPQIITQDPFIFNQASKLVKKSPLQAAALYKKLSGSPDILKRDASGLLSPDAKIITPDNISNYISKPPKLYVQRGVSQLPNNMAHEMAMDNIWRYSGDDLIDGLMPSVMDRYPDIPEMAIYRPVSHAEHAAHNYLNSLIRESDDYRYALNDVLEAHGDEVMGPQFGRNFYNNTQRISSDSNPYFETVLRGGLTPGKQARIDAATGIDHFMNPKMVAYTRGSVGDDGRVFLDEVQSDSAKLMKNKFGTTGSNLVASGWFPNLEDPHAQMVKAMIGQTTKAGADSVSIPTALKVASARDPANLGGYKQIYDDELGKRIYRPMSEAGIPITQDANGWNNINLGDTDRIMNWLSGQY